MVPTAKNGASIPPNSTKNELNMYPSNGANMRQSAKPANAPTITENTVLERASVFLVIWNVFFRSISSGPDTSVMSSIVNLGCKGPLYPSSSSSLMIQLFSCVRFLKENRSGNRTGKVLFAYPLRFSFCGCQIPR